MESSVKGESPGFEIDFYEFLTLCTLDIICGKYVYEVFKGLKIFGQNIQNKIKIFD